MPFTPGSRVGHFEIGEPIGAGGMAEAFTAHDTGPGRTAAIKISKQQFSERLEPGSPRARRR